MAGAEGIIKIPELRKRIIFTLLMLAVYRIGVHIPTPGIDAEALKQVFQNMQGTIFGWFNIFNGGALERFSILSLGVMPYISSAIIFELLTVVWPYLHELQKEGEQGQKKITQYTRYGNVVLCLIQGYGIATGLEHTSPSVVLHPGFSFQIFTALTLTCGSTFLMWVGEQMSEHGIGNGISLLIFAGIAARMPSGLSSVLSLYRSGEMSFFKIVMIVLVVIAVFFVIVYIEQGARRIPVQYAKRIVGRKVYGGQNTNLPMKVNTAGVIPPIFASSLIMFPATFAAFFPNSEKIREFTQLLNPSSVVYDVFYVGLIIFFCYFYTAVTFKTEDVADNLKKYGGFIPGIRPGPPTAKYIEYVLSRITLGGAVYIATICVLPMILTSKMKVPFYFGGTSILILIEVGLDTVAQIETFLLTRNYEGFMKHTRVRSRAFT